MNGASSGLAESTDVGIGSDDEVTISGFVVEVCCNIDELVADVETCGKKDHCCEECDYVHSCIFFIVNIIIFYFCLENQLLIINC